MRWYVRTNKQVLVIFYVDATGNKKERSGQAFNKLAVNYVAKFVREIFLVKRYKASNIIWLKIKYVSIMIIYIRVLFYFVSCHI